MAYAWIAALLGINLPTAKSEALVNNTYKQKKK